MRVAENPKCKEGKDMLRTPDDDMRTLVEYFKTLEKSEIEECIKTVVGMIVCKVTRLEKIKARLLELLNSKYEIDIDELSSNIQDICDEFGYCETCPVEVICYTAVIKMIKRLKEEGKISDDKLVKYIVEIMLKHNIKPKALPGFDAMRIVREAREE
jgi:hypothetical protein